MWYGACMWRGTSVPYPLPLPMPVPTFPLPVAVESPAETSASEGATHRNTEPTINPATTRQRGSITYNRENGYNLEWESIDEFHQWRENEQRAHGIEIRIGKTVPSKGSALYTDYQVWVCLCQGTGGAKVFHRQTDRKAKKEGKRLPEGRLPMPSYNQDLPPHHHCPGKICS